MILNDAHCHFFSTNFFAALGRGMPGVNPEHAADAALAKLGWDPPGTAEHLADRWVAELERRGVARAALIASVPGDAESVAAALRRHPTRFVGFFMVDPMQPEAHAGAADAIDRIASRSLPPQMVEAGRRRAQRFTWSGCADSVIKLMAPSAERGPT